MLQHVNSRKQGDIGVAAAISWFVRNGYTVSIPLSDSQRYDLIVDNEEYLLRVQVKTTTVTKRSGSYEVALRTCGGNRSGTGVVRYFDKSAADLLFVLTESGDHYLIPTSKLQDNTSGIVVGLKWAQYKIT